MPRVYRRKSYRRKKKAPKLATKKYVKKLIAKEAETKYYDVASIGSVDASGSIILLTDVPQGTTDITRIGDKLTLRGLRIKLQFGIADNHNMLRIIVFQWYPNTSLVSPIYNSILSTASGGLTSFMSYLVHDFQNQFNVLYDKTISVDTYNRHQITIMKKIKMKYVKKTIAFSGGSTAGSNHIYMLLVSDSTAASHPGVNMYSRVYFDDS